VGSECETDEDCTETAGCQGGVTLGFECVLGNCKSVCCNTDAECLDWAWTEACEGRFECTRFHCAQRCDDLLCGNDICDTTSGDRLRLWRMAVLSPGLLAGLLRRIVGCPVADERRNGERSTIERLFA
jgi:hypothetical protein